jgi:hypothetical protein
MMAAISLSMVLGVGGPAQTSGGLEPPVPLADSRTLLRLGFGVDTSFRANGRPCCRQVTGLNGILDLVMTAWFHWESQIGFELGRWPRLDQGEGTFNGSSGVAFDLGNRFSVSGVGSTTVNLATGDTWLGPRVAMAFHPLGSLFDRVRLKFGFEPLFQITSGSSRDDFVPRIYVAMDVFPYEKKTRPKQRLQSADRELEELLRSLRPRSRMWCDANRKRLAGEPIPDILMSIDNGFGVTASTLYASTRRDVDAYREQVRVMRRRRMEEARQDGANPNQADVQPKVWWVMRTDGRAVLDWVCGTD